jgi:uncharacterized phage protein gp47/JayE
MPITLKTFSNFMNLIKAKFNATLPGVDPSINGGLANAVSLSSGLAGYALQDVIQDANNQSFIPTQDDGFLDISGTIDSTSRLNASPANGYVAVNGTLSTIIPTNKILTYLALFYANQAASTVNNYTGSIGLLSYNANGTVTATTNNAHTMSTGLSITISGASQSSLNGTFTITVLDIYTFTYTVGAGLGLLPDSGTYSGIYALMFVQCTTSGSNTNVGAGSALGINVSNINSTAYVGPGQLQGGADLESTTNYRTRLLQAHNLTPGISSANALISSLKKVSGVTRLWIPPVTNGATQVSSRGSAGYYPLLGETIIYIVNDSASPITPSSTILTNCYNQIWNDGLISTLLPWNTTNATYSNYWIVAPTLFTPYISLHLTANDTTSLRTAIQAQLNIFFQENASVGYPIGLVSTNTSLKLLLTFIQDIQDPNSGIFVAGNYQFLGWGLTSGTLSTTADLPVASGSLPVGPTISGSTLIFS